MASGAALRGEEGGEEDALEGRGVGGAGVGWAEGGGRGDARGVEGGGRVVGAREEEVERL